MNTLIIILLILAGLIALLLISGLFMRKEHFVKREIIVNAPIQKVFNYIKLLKNQDEFNKHAMTSPDRQREFKGVDGTKGYIYSWSGDKNAGVGEKEIKNIIEDQKIETEIRFIKPMAVTANVVMETEPVSADQTRVSWSNSGILNYPFNIMIPVFEKNVAKDMDSSLLNLKNILER
jgi:hypothetical protein